MVSSWAGGMRLQLMYGCSAVLKAFFNAYFRLGNIVKVKAAHQG